jgi:hypothetical protein
MDILGWEQKQKAYTAEWETGEVPETFPFAV